MQPRDFKSYLRRTILVPVILLALLAGVLLWQITYMVSAFHKVDQSDRVISAARLMLQRALDMESGLRGYLLTGDEQFLQPYNAALQSEAAVEGQLKELVAKDPEQSQSVKKIQAEIEDWKTYARSMIESRRSNSSDAKATSTNLLGKSRMDAIRREFDALLADAERLREQRSQGAQRATRTALITLATLTASVAVVLVVVTRFRLLALTETYDRHIEAALRQSEEARSNREWLLTTLRSIGEGVIATDPDGHIDFINSAAEALTGWQQAEARGRPVTDILRIFDERTGVPIQDPSEFVRSRKNQTAPSVVSALERRDNERCVIEESAAPILTESGELQGIVLVFRDITERRRTESILRSSERLALVGRLSATIAHEIQNPLDAVTNLLYLIDNTEGLPQTAMQFSQLAQDEVRRISQITRQLLSFNREAREPVPVDIGDVIDSVIGLFGAKLTSSGIRVKKDYDTNEKVFGLPGELRQVFSNLIGNAMEATPKGGAIQIRVSSGTDWHNPRRKGVRVVISDNGSGIPINAKRRLFTPFFTTKGEKGTGLGLWVSKGIIEKHEGALRFRSSTNGSRRGTTFSVFLPFGPSARVQAGNAA
jgi:PAS domain S-box-containing protein